VWLVEQAPLTKHDLVPQSSANALSVREVPGEPLVRTLLESMKPKRLLLVLNNCEHLLAACATLAAAILRDCPEVWVLATSREALNISGETTYRLPSLSLPAIVESGKLRVERSGSDKPAVVGPLNSQPSTLNWSTATWRDLSRRGSTRSRSC